MGDWVTFGGSLWESFVRWLFILVICSINLRAGIRFGGKCMSWWVSGSVKVARIRCGEFGNMRKFRGLVEGLGEHTRWPLGPG